MSDTGSLKSVEADLQLADTHLEDAENSLRAAENVEESMHRLMMRHRQLLRADHDLKNMTEYAGILRSRLAALEGEIRNRTALASEIRQSFHQEKMLVREAVDQLRHAAERSCARSISPVAARDAMERVDDLLSDFMVHVRDKTYPLTTRDFGLLESEIAHLLLMIDAPGHASSEANTLEDEAVARSLLQEVPSRRQQIKESFPSSAPDPFKNALTLKTDIDFLTRRDLPDVLDVYASANHASLSEDDFLVQLRQRNCMGMVSYTDWRCTGFMLYELHKWYINVKHLAVHATLQNRGIGNVLMQKLIDKLHQQRRTHLLFTLRESQEDGYRFLMHHGCKPVDVKRRHFTNGEDAWRLMYAVPEHSSDEVSFDGPQGEAVSDFE